jgi:hypothetical protein
LFVFVAMAAQIESDPALDPGNETDISAERYAFCSLC